MSNQIAAAKRHANALALMKWLLTALIVLLTIGACVGIGAAEEWPVWTLYLQPFVGAAGFGLAVWTFLGLGYLQYTLRMQILAVDNVVARNVVGIATNSASAGEPVHVAMTGGAAAAWADDDAIPSHGGEVRR